MGVLVVVLVTAFIMLGRWQLDRLEQRRERNSTVVAHENDTAQPYDEVMNKVIQDGDQWFKVTATGTYEPQQFQVRYRSLNGNYGSEIVGVLTTDEGDHLLVDRGFLQRDPGHPDGQMPAPMTGKVTVTGYVHRNENGDSTAVDPHGDQVRLINSDALGSALGKDLINGYIILIDSVPADTGGLTPVGTPELTEGSHFSYALQWFSFAAVAVIGLIVLIRADIRDRRKEKLRAEKAAAAKLSGDDAAGTSTIAPSTENTTPSPSSTALAGAAATPTSPAGSGASEAQATPQSPATADPAADDSTDRTPTA